MIFHKCTCVIVFRLILQLCIRVHIIYIYKYMCSGQFPDPTERTFVLNLPGNADILQNHAKSRYIWYSSHSWLVHMDLQPDGLSFPLRTATRWQSLQVNQLQSKHPWSPNHPPRPCMTHIHPTCVASDGCCR